MYNFSIFKTLKNEKRIILKLKKEEV